MGLEKSFKKIIDRRRQEIVDKKTKNIRDVSSKKENGKESCYHVLQCESLTFLKQSNSDEKYFILERWKRIEIIGTPAAKNLKVGDIEYRLCYYIMSRKPETKTPDRWIYGQYSPMISHEDLFKLIELAKSEKTIET